MKLEIIKATIEQKPILANLLELYAYDFTEFCDFDIGDDGFFGYEHLSLYWIEPTRIPYIIYIDHKVAGLILVQKTLSILERSETWDVTEFFIMKKYKRKGAGTAAALKLWAEIKGLWQVRVLTGNPIACSFWDKTIHKFTITTPIKIEKKIRKNKDVADHK